MSILAAALIAALGVSPAPEPADGCLALTGGAVWLSEGPVDGATVVWDGAQIRSVDADGGVPEGCDRVDVTGKVVTAGLVEARTQMGVVEVGLESATVDTRAAPQEDPTPWVRASFAVHEAYNPRSPTIPVTRVGGVTSAVVAPSGGLVHGRAAWVDLAGATQAEAVRGSSVGMNAEIGGGSGSRAEALHRLRLLLDEARAFASRRDDWEVNRARPFRHLPAELEAMAPVATGELPLVVAVNRASDIEAVLRLADTYELRLVVAGGAEAWLHADLLAERGVPVIVDPLLNLPASFDAVHARADNAAILADAGVPLVLSTFSSHNARNLRQVAGNAVRAGLDRQAALRAITRTPAEVYGMEAHGRLEPGARANVVVWSGDPLELSTAVERLWIGGREIPLVTRQTLLMERYRELPGTPPEPLPLP